MRQQVEALGEAVRIAAFDLLISKTDIDRHRAMGIAIRTKEAFMKDCEAEWDRQRQPAVF